MKVIVSLLVMVAALIIAALLVSLGVPLNYVLHCLFLVSILCCAQASSVEPKPNRLGRGRIARIEDQKDQILGMLGQDRRLAQRLLEQCRREHPDRDMEWHLSKIIHDLLRDRR